MSEQNNYKLGENELFLLEGIVTDQDGKEMFNLYKDYDENEVKKYTLIVNKGVGMRLGKSKKNIKLSNVECMGGATLFKI